MVEFTHLCLALAGTLCFSQGQTFTISTKFINGRLIFTWSNISTYRNDILIEKDSESTGWLKVYNDEYILQNMTQYKSVTITVREYTPPSFRDFDDHKKTYNVTKVESEVGESRNISWTTEYFPRSGSYRIFHVYNGSVSKILQITNTNPSTTKYIYHTRPFNSTNIMFEVKNIALEDAGYYVGGTSEEDAWSGERGVVLIVYGKPVPPIIRRDLNITVKSYTILKCESRSTSAPYYYKFSPLSYSWFVNNTRQNKEIKEIYRLYVTKDVKYNKYSCQARESLESQRSEEIQINPLYGPESVIITPELPRDDVLNILDGDKFGPYNCSADCNPPCTLQWKYKNPSDGFYEATSIASSLITLPEQTANRSSMVSIRCVVKGVEGTSKSNIKLNILYFLEPKVYVNGRPENASPINEKSPLLLSCFVEGNPTPEVTLRKLTGNLTLGSRGKNWLNYTLDRGAQCSDTSTYRCEGTSTKFGSKMQSFSIKVLCEPRLDEFSTIKTNYGSMSGPDVKVVVRLPVVANPLTSTSGFTWTGPTSESISTKVSERDAVIYKHWINSTIPIPDKSSFGNYTLQYNGKSIADITISAEDKPQPPLNFTGYSYDNGYINLTWLSNFNGGPEQFFVLSRKEGSRWNIIANLTDPGEGNMGYHDLGPLSPGQQYWYQIESCNRISCSSRPAEVKVTVRALSSSSSQLSETTIVIGASMAVFVFIVVLAIIVAVYLLKKKSVKQRQKSDKQSSEPTVQDNTQPDVVVYAAVDKSLLMKNKQQADVVKSDLIKDKNDELENVYSNTEEAKLLSKSDGKKENKKKKGEKQTQQEDEEETGATYGNVESRTVNQDGLIYIDVDFANKPFSSDTKGKPVIHGEEERTEYTFVDFSKRASPIQEREEGN